ncbi:restriction endonuclease [Arcobacter sp. YIC-310]|uniref:restriction endonuclease n=1 Tax=Arcobacter sp. YIC-310 TaxID=3376632 RepID=UPI003C1D5651
MIGTIEVYLYNDDNGRREDLTTTLGTKNFNLYEHKFELVRIVEMVYSSKYLKNVYISFYTLLDITPDFLPKFFMNDCVFKIKGGIEHRFSSDKLSCSIKDHNKRNKYGNDYEEFISNKYKSAEYKVELRGIKESFNDGGLDLIAKKNNIIVLVQCKNWKMSNSYKVNQKDLRAFVGDCFLYLKDKNLEGKKVSYHFIVSHDNILTKSAEIFLKENQFIKFKCVPFE